MTTLFGRNLDSDRPHLTSGLVWQPARERGRVATLTGLFFPFRRDATVERGISVTREVFVAMVNMARARHASPLVVVPHLGAESAPDTRFVAASSTRRRCRMSSSNSIPHGMSRGITTQTHVRLASSPMRLRRGCAPIAFHRHPLFAWRVPNDLAAHVSPSNRSRRRFLSRRGHRRRRARPRSFRRRACPRIPEVERARRHRARRRRLDSNGAGQSRHQPARVSLQGRIAARRDQRLLAARPVQAHQRSAYAARSVVSASARDDCRQQRQRVRALHRRTRSVED